MNETDCRLLNACNPRWSQHDNNEIHYGSIISIREGTESELQHDDADNQQQGKQSSESFEMQRQEEAREAQQSSVLIGVFLLAFLLVGIVTVLTTGGSTRAQSSTSYEVLGSHHLHNLPMLGSTGTGRASRTLIILRHAKSSRDDPSLKDIDRPLSKTGEDEIRHVSNYLKNEKIAPPEIIYASPSVRTMETVKALGMKDVPVVYDQKLYDLASKNEGYTTYVLGLDSKYNRVMIVGHNPACLHLVQELAHFRMLFKYPTATYSEIYWRRASDWSDATNQRGKIINFIEPAGK